MALRSLALRAHGGGASLLTLLSSVSRRHLSSVPRCRLPLPRPLVAAAKLAPLPRAAVTPRCLSTSGSTTSTINDPTPNWSNRPPKETILLDGCDFEHWLVVVDPPDPSLTRDEIIKSYIQTLAKVVGSDEEARFKIYSVSTKHYFAFGALVSEELSYKIKELPGVRWVLPDSYLDVKNKDYGGEPFINGEAVPYDPKYHEEWVRNNARAMERNRRNDRPRNFDRSRNFERRRENMQTFQNRSAPPPSPMQAQDTRYQPSPGPMNPGNAPGQGPVPSPMQAQDTRYQPSPGPMNPGNAPGQGPVPSPMNPQNTMPPPSSMHIPPPPPTPGPNESNMGGVNYSPYQNQMPQQSTIPPPMSGQNFQPGMPPRTSPNPNPNYGYQNQMPNYPNNPPPHANPSYRPSYPPGNNAYQGHQNAYQDGPPRYQGPPNSYPGNPGGYQVPSNRYPADSNGVIDQVGDGGNTGPYQGQDLPPGRRY